MIFKDYYKVLGIPNTASNEQIRKRYLELVRQYHPDKHPGEEKVAKAFSEINEAYHHLGDLERRLKYHALLSKNQNIRDEAKRRLDDRKGVEKRVKRKTVDDKLDDLIRKYK
jgi:curved DNA-binding protein CbpA